MKKKTVKKVTKKAAKTAKKTGNTARKKMTKEERQSREVERFRELISQPRAGLNHDFTEPREVEPVELRGIGLSDILYLSPEDLKPNPLNEKFFRRESEDYFGKLADDIGERGVIVPLIAKMDGTLLAGHNRLLVALQLGMEHIPVQKVTEQLPEAKEKEFLIKDNYLRRHLSADEKESLIRELYSEEIMKLKKGGDRGNQYTGGKDQLISGKADGKDQLIFGGDVPGTLPEKIERETGIKKNTARRIITKIRKEEPIKPGEVISERPPLTDAERERRDELKRELDDVDNEIDRLVGELAKLKAHRRTRRREFENLGGTRFN